ncbi:MAG: lactate racemase domain-containing protein, partial [Phycisphaerae bacterium]|nr:lactate racemase domain-containing protein [Phycisphaerae bacterium]
MKTHLQYGKTGLDLEIPASNVSVYQPRFVPGLPDEAAGFRAAVREPISSPPLRELISPADSVAVVIPDITRPFPSDRVLPWLFEELAYVPAANFTIINGTGSHIANTPKEIMTMVGPGIAEKYRIINHNAYEFSTMTAVGSLPDGHAVLMNSEYTRADKRIVLGFIEPHFMAGYSGGRKGVCPALADKPTVQRFHNYTQIADPRSTTDNFDGNPV